MSPALLTRVLRDAGAARGLDLLQWDVLVRQARHANLLGRLHLQLDATGVEVPERPARHLQSAAMMAARQHLSVHYEVRALQQVLAPLGVPLVLLKGAAYVMAGLPAARGRVFSDVDILLPRAVLDEAESLLAVQGWSGDKLDAYDQRYYRRWMHELPPLMHLFRGTALDVHHTILPPTSRSHVDAAALLRDAVEVPGHRGVWVLAPVDMVLHSAAHLFHEGEPDNLLRDLSDLDLLMRHWGAEADFWRRLLARAEQHGLQRPLRLALRYCHQELQTPVPTDVLAGSGAGRPEPVLDFMYARALRPMHASASDAWTAWCCRTLYIRSHWLRMPLPLLVYHLLHKALRPPQSQALDDNR
ncbi:nucleotidyltransferase family protein [Pelomonas cellulosilytica]|uniref:Nucleotidyltransferase family protein n=1 Tax=Pelomonas cellulosilytica TaxID=2906762 RepID=A0ABS8XLT3_9BURK|nr:nucleotidyltransferase family protein [Pelomonas sp. P8]MCE4553742.1 nucleotidyltransferase family protein [Pelomonas sp. P8]